MPMQQLKNMYAIRLDALFTPREMEIALKRFKTREGVVEFTVDFCDYTYIFGQNNLIPRDVNMEKEPHVFDVIANACRRLRDIIRLSDTLQIDNFKMTRTTVFILVRHEVPTHERTGNL